MSYQALYRKWRPTDFKDVKGQDHIVTTLQNQIKSDRIGHAYLFCGTRGTGKTTIAKIMAKAVNCENPIDGNPCGNCPTCQAVAAGNSMNVIEIDAASNNGVENIRQIREEVQYSPTEGKYKVYIIDEVHMLSDGAFNALLKTLEEPPSYVIFILATTEAHKIPITVLSRCQRYDFHRISIETIASRLSDLMKEEGINVEEKAIRYVAKAADGSMRDALSLLDQCIAFYLGKDLTYENVLEVLGAVDTSVFQEMLELELSGDTSGCMKLIEKLVMQGRDLQQFINDFIWYLRNLLLVKTTDDQSGLENVIDVSADNLKLLLDIAKKVDMELLMRYIRVLSELSNELKFATQKRIKVEIALIKLAKPAMDAKEDMGEILSRMSQLEAQLEDMSKKLKEGSFVSNASLNTAVNAASMAGDNGQPSGIAGVAPNPNKRVVEALPEDVKEIVANWYDIINAIQDPAMSNYLKMSRVTLGADGKSLELVFKSTSVYNYVNREDNMKYIVEQIEEATGITVNIIATNVDSDEDFQNRYTDIVELVNFKIDVDDDEEDLI